MSPSSTAPNYQSDRVIQTEILANANVGRLDGAPYEAESSKDTVSEYHSQSPHVVLTAASSTVGERSKMTAPTREEVHAQLATVEARAETRFVELSGKIDRLADSVTTLTTGVTNQLAEVRREVRSENTFTRWTIVIAVLTSLIGAVAALWVTQGNLLSAFSAGLSLRSEAPPPPAAQTKKP